MNINVNSKNKDSDTKSHILNVGYQLISKKGFTAVGLKEILETARVPKGSFYYYFDSKEAFGKAIIEHYLDKYQKNLDIISNKPITAQDKLYEYFKFWYETQQNGGSGGKCLVVKLSGEISDISDPMRQALSKTSQIIINWLTHQIKSGWEDGSLAIKQNIAAESLANRWYFAWLGASLIAKVNHSNIPLAEVWQMTLSELGR